MTHRSLLSRRLALVLGAALALTAAQLGLGAVAGCGSTSGQRISLGTRVVAADGVAEPFENAFGWKVQLTKARVSVGELYYFTGPPVVAGLTPRPSRPGVRSLFSIPSAHAHPGHYTEGDALGQMLAPQAVDLLADTDLAEAEAVTGRYESARFSFASPPVGDLAEGLEGHVVLVEGEATKDATTVAFRVTADEEDILNADGNAFVEGCVFEAADVEAEGTVTVTLHPSVWFDQVDFAKAPAPTGTDLVVLPPGEAPQKAFTRGLKKGTAYTFAYAP